MAQPIETEAFGRRGAARAAPGRPPAPNRQSPSEAPKLGNPLLSFLDKVFLWLPGERSPGPRAVAVVIVRQAALPVILGIMPILILVASGANFFQFLNASAERDAYAYVAMGALVACVALVQELNRYAFARRADRTVRALVIITVVEIAFALIFSHDRLYTMGWQAAEQVAASIALFFGLKLRKHIGAIILLIVVGHGAVDLIAPQFFRPPDVKSSTPLHMAAESVVAPTVGDMRAWAKLYPGSIVTSAKSSSMLGLTSWRVEYTTPASPELVGAFYQATAKAEGFTDTQSFGGVTSFRQSSNQNEFHYMAVANSTGAEVIFEARTFAAK